MATQYNEAAEEDPRAGNRFENRLQQPHILGWGGGIDTTIQSSQFGADLRGLDPFDDAFIPATQY